MPVVMGGRWVLRGVDIGCCAGWMLGAVLGTWG